MKLTDKQIEMVKKAESADSLIPLAKKAGIKASDNDIKEIYNLYHNNQKLSDEEIQGIAAGTVYRNVKIGGERRDYVVTTCGNSCDLFNRAEGGCKTCTHCSHLYITASRWYCNARWKGNDPVHDK